MFQFGGVFLAPSTFILLLTSQKWRSYSSDVFPMMGKIIPQISFQIIILNLVKDTNLKTYCQVFFLKI